VYRNKNLRSGKDSKKGCRVVIIIIIIIIIIINIFWIWRCLNQSYILDQRKALLTTNLSLPAWLNSSMKLFQEPIWMQESRGGISKHYECTLPPSHCTTITPPLVLHESVQLANKRGLNKTKKLVLPRLRAVHESYSWHCERETRVGIWTIYTQTDK
jgi:hypothetical protein